MSSGNGAKDFLRGRQLIGLVAIIDVVVIVFALVFIFYVACGGGTALAVDTLSTLHAWHLALVALVLIMIIDVIFEPVVIAIIALIAGAFDVYALVTRIMAIVAGDTSLCTALAAITDGAFLMLAFLFVLASLFAMKQYGCFGGGGNGNYTPLASKSTMPADDDMDVGEAQERASGPLVVSSSSSAHRRMLLKAAGVHE